MLLHIPEPAELAFNDAYAATLRRLRLKQRLSRRRLGAIVGVHRNTIERWERGAAMPSIWLDRKLREVLRPAAQPVAEEAAEEVAEERAA